MVSQEMYNGITGDVYLKVPVITEQTTDGVTSAV